MNEMAELNKIIKEVGALGYENPETIPLTDIVQIMLKHTFPIKQVKLVLDLYILMVDRAEAEKTVV